MSLVLLLIIPFVGGIAAWVVSRWSATACRWVALASSLAGFGLALGEWAGHFGRLVFGATGAALDNPPSGLRSHVFPDPFGLDFDHSWIPQAGIRFHLGADGLSLIMLMLTFVMVALAVLASWKGVRQRTGLFHFTLMFAAASLAGVFVALDLFLFYFFFELMLIPFFLLIALWGHEKRRAAAIKFFIYTQAGGLLMLISIVALYFLHGRQTGEYTFDYLRLVSGSFTGWTGALLMLGFFVAFAVKLPAIPLHGWLPDAHSQANTAGSVLLAGLLIKVGAYGFLRFLIPLFPDAALHIRYVAMALGVAGILYGAVMAFSQTDLKRMVAYTSVSHMGFILVGVFAWNRIAINGVVLQMVCHAFSTGGLFILAGVLEERLGTRDLRQMGGLWAGLSTLGGFGMVLAMAALGLPGLGNFVAEFLILLGAFSVSRPIAILAALGLIVSTVYALWLVQKVFHGEEPAAASAAAAPAGPAAQAGPAALGGQTTQAGRRTGLSAREIVMFAATIIVLLWLGLFPQTLFRTFGPSADFLLQSQPAAAAQQQQTPASSPPTAEVQP